MDKLYLIEIFCMADDFCKELEKRNMLTDNNKKNNAGRKAVMTIPEIITICCVFPTSGYKNFKHFYSEMYKNVEFRSYFPEMIKYKQFNANKNFIAPILLLFTKLLCEIAGSDVSYIDSSKLAVCHNRRISSHKVFKHIAKRGKTSVCWFFGFKLHFVINIHGELIDIAITRGNVADCSANLIRIITKKITGKVYGDRGYHLNKKITEELKNRDVTFVAKPKKNMKNKKPMSPTDAFFSKHRGIAESVLNVLKGSLGLEHSRHRSLGGFFSHIASVLGAYCFRDKKPRLNFELLSCSSPFPLSL